MTIPRSIFLILTLISFIKENKGCELELHNNGFLFTENYTCSNLEDMNDSQGVCTFSGHICTITFLGEIRILKTRSFSRIVSLDQVFLNDTKITRLERMAFVGSPNIRFIHLERNQINSIPDELFSTLSSLEFLDLHGNIMEEIEGKTLSAEALNYLDLSSNKLRKFSLSRMSPLLSLKFLNLSGNQITEIQRESLENLHQLITLDFSNNKLQTLPIGLFKDLENLSYLDISSNELKTLQHGTFNGAFNLKILNLSGNNLRHLESTIFQPLRNVVDIDVSDNQITSLDIKSLNIQNLDSLKIHGNNFTCTKLHDILVEAHEIGLRIPGDPKYNEENSYRIGCIDDMPEHHTISRETDANSDENILEMLGQLAEEEKNLLKNISSEVKISNSILTNNSKATQQISENIDSTNKFLEKLIEFNEELLEAQKHQLRNGSRETAFEEHNKINAGQGISGKMDITNNILLKLMEIVEKNGVFNNLSSKSSSTIHSQNGASLTAENSEIKNVISSLNDLKILLTICTIIMIMFCVVKLIRRLRTNSFVNKHVLEDHELPFVEHINNM